MNLPIKKILVLLVALSGILITALLGRWQLQRAAEKEQYQAAINDKKSYPVLQSAQLVSSGAPEQLVHQPVAVSGTWLSHATVLLDNRQMQGRVGFFVMTPLQLDQAPWVVWVQRGWIARHFLEREQILDFETPSGKVVIQGLIAPPPSKLYTFETAEQGRIRQNLDLQAHQWGAGIHTLPVLVRQTGPASEGLLRDWPQVDSGVQKHYGYAVQWFGLSALIVILWVWFQWLAPWYNRFKKDTHHV
jgi:surfeit locus 1 family protein